MTTKEKLKKKKLSNIIINYDKLFNKLKFYWKTKCQMKIWLTITISDREGCYNIPRESYKNLMNWNSVYFGW